MSLFETDRVKNVERFLGRTMALKAHTLESKGEKLIHFEIGQPPFQTPKHIVDATIQALRDGHTRYVQTQGIPDLRQAIATKLENENKIIADYQSEIIVTVGSQNASFLAFICTIKAGDEVIITNPGYYNYKNCVLMAEGKPVFVPLLNEDGFNLDLDTLEKSITSKSKMIVLNSPCNPTGSMLTKSDLKAIDDLAIEHDLLVLSDEIYEKIVYDEVKHYSLAALSQDPQRIITLNGFSKAYAMTGWRIGYAVANRILVSSMEKVQGSILACASAFAQRGAITALQGTQEPLKEMLKEFTKRRAIVLDGLHKVRSVDVFAPQGAFYAFLDIRKLETSSMDFADYLLRKAKIVTTPGVAFGDNGEGYIRLSFAASIPDLTEGMKRIAQAVEEL